MEQTHEAGKLVPIGPVLLVVPLPRAPITLLAPFLGAASSL